MRPSYLNDSRPAMHFLFSLLIVLASWLVFQLLALLTGAFFFDVGIQEIQAALNDYQDPVNIAYQKYLQSVISLGMFVVAPLIIAFSLSDNILKYFRLDYYPGHSVAFLIALVMTLSLPMNNYFTYLNGQLSLPEGFSGIQDYMEDKEQQAQQVFERFLNVRGIWPLLINILVIGIIPSIGEELLFRGVLQKIFIKWTKNAFLGVFITSLAFAILHFQFLSVLPRFVLGLILGYMFVWTRSLWMPIIAHFVNNTLAVVYYHLMYNNKIGEGIENVGKPENDPVYAILSIVIVSVLLFVIRRIMIEKAN
ncbi:MAG: CPBP family intramembrane glutamic endopeptidase [Bacteroidota bacterium]